MRNRSSAGGRLRGGWRWGAVLVLAALTGCASSGAASRITFKDPGYLEYQRAVDDLDREYLNKQITYLEYKERKQQLDTRYHRTTVDASRSY